MHTSHYLWLVPISLLWYRQDTRTEMSSCDSPLVPFLCAAVVLLILKSQFSFMDRVYDGGTFLDTDASTTAE